MIYTVESQISRTENILEPYSLSLLYREESRIMEGGGSFLNALGRLSRIGIAKKESQFQL